MEDLNNMLIEATYESDIDKVAKLIANGADVNARNEDGDTALMVAAGDCRTDICALLLNHGADVNARGSGWFGSSALMCAVFYRSIDVVALLIKHGADVNARDNYDTTALMMANDCCLDDHPIREVSDRNRSRRQAIGKLLLEHGAEVMEKD